jgi:secreted trypsin-like serine protease
VGIVGDRSYGSCGSGNNVSVYTRVSSVRAWILSISAIKDIPNGMIKAVAMP